jgi:ketopantoate reductase
MKMPELSGLSTKELMAITKKAMKLTSNEERIAAIKVLSAEALKRAKEYPDNAIVQTKAATLSSLVSKL